MRGVGSWGGRMRIRLQIRSALAMRNAADRSGSAGSPEISNPTASASVVPNESVISTQVRPGRSEKTIVAPRKSAKKSTSGRPSWAELCSPGSGKAIESASKTCGCCSTITFVGPRKTE